MVLRKVVRNADDFGLNEEVNQAIYEKLFMEEIDSTSLLVVTKGFNDAIDIIRSSPLIINVGLHLSLTIPWMSFRRFLFCYFTGQVSKSYIYWAWDKQIRLFLKAGLPLERVDSHHGVHFFPVCWQVLMTLTKKYGIKYVRNPDRRFCWFHYNPKIWISRNKSWVYQKINGKLPTLPYEEIVCHEK